MPVRILARLILSRLALPNHVRTILLLDDSSLDPDVWRHLNVQFHHVAVKRVSSDTLLRRARSTRARPIPSATRRYVQLVTAFLLNATGAEPPAPRARLIDRAGAPKLRSAASDGPPPEVLERLPAAMLAETAEANYSRGVVLVRPDVRSHERTLSEQFRRYMPLVPLLTFSIDNGVPYVRRPFLGIFQPTDPRVGDATFGSLRLRAAASGWAIVRRDGERDLQLLRDRMITWAKNHTHERA